MIDMLMLRMLGLQGRDARWGVSCRTTTINDTVMVVGEGKLAGHLLLIDSAIYPPCHCGQEFILGLSFHAASEGGGPD